MAIWPSWGGRRVQCPGRRAPQHSSPTDPELPSSIPSEVKPRVFVAGYLPSTARGASP
ncbi:hypothetical protein BT67DRAFT_438897 [Trichocladium antarcticum]|uniref:Uncharacterized protein n=1 Tax=Trichocladium antarcticum TaxID=1450529 RepID=A0AAN6ZGK9_9PEZI|nr:hypothetical protein BT67DRAFT_438897 [Trichocladium antarcticum]